MVRLRNLVQPSLGKQGSHRQMVNFASRASQTKLGLSPSLIAMGSTCHKELVRQEMTAPLTTSVPNARETMRLTLAAKNPKRGVAREMAPREPVLAKNPLPTPIDWQLLDACLEGYHSDLREFLVNGFRYGFRIKFEGASDCRAAKNSVIAQNNPVVLEQFVQKEMSFDRLYGLYNTLPFSHCHPGCNCCGQKIGGWNSDGEG